MASKRQKKKILKGISGGLNEVAKSFGGTRRDAFREIEKAIDQIWKAQQKIKREQAALRIREEKLARKEAELAKRELQFNKKILEERKKTQYWRDRTTVATLKDKKNLTEKQSKGLAAAEKRITVYKEERHNAYKNSWVSQLSNMEKNQLIRYLYSKGFSYNKKDEYYEDFLLDNLEEEDKDELIGIAAEKAAQWEEEKEDLSWTQAFFSDDFDPFAKPKERQKFIKEFLGG